MSMHSRWRNGNAARRRLRNQHVPTVRAMPNSVRASILHFNIPLRSCHSPLALTPSSYVNAANGNNPVNEQFITCQCTMKNGKLTPNAHIMQADDDNCTPALAVSGPSCQLDGSHSPYTCDCSTWNPGTDTPPDVYNPCWQPS